jgi:hypothetical protein
MAAGTVHGHLKAQPDTVVVWVDAHADINPPLASKSGNFHGMVLSFLVHELQDYVPHIPIFDWLTPWYCDVLRTLHDLVKFYNTFSEKTSVIVLY